jgi:hypothetical protein
MSVIDRVKTHFETLKTITIEVEQWKDEHGNASVFYSEPLTLEEKNIIFKKSNNFQDLTILVDLLIMKLQVKNDKGEMIKAFIPEDKFALRRNADSNVIANIANQILADTKLRGSRKKVDSEPEIRSLLIVADRLHIPIQQVLDMPVSHYNLWLAYLKKEQEQYKTKQSLADARNFK